ncbi:MAG: oligopeptide:H+ symporter, partial [Alphaproteobacteria bacterium]|nr:oligopeptide:H+ symporter [Alphaproteobacteria bacterium]
MTRALSRQTAADRFNHPPFLKTLFIAEAAGNFSHYGMRNLLVLYMIDALLFQDERAFSVYASFVAVLYITPMVGGLLADRYMTLKSLIYSGATLIILGTVLLTFPLEHAFYFGLSVVAIGYGFYRPSVLRVLSKIYGPDDPRREAGFTIFFTAANLGPLFASLICGWVAVTYGWQWGFIIAASSMLVTIGVFLKNNDFMNALDEGRAKSHVFMRMAPILGFFVPLILIFSCVAGYLIYEPGLFHGVVLTISSMIALYLGFIILKLNRIMRLRVLVILILLSYHMLFFAFFEQLSSSVTLFVDRVVVRDVRDFTVPTLWFQGLNPIFIVLLGPVISSVWIYLRKKNYDLSVAFKFIMAFLMIALGFIEEAALYSALAAQQHMDYY